VPFEKETSLTGAAIRCVILRTITTSRTNSIVAGTFIFMAVASLKEVAFVAFGARAFAVDLTLCSFRGFAVLTCACILEALVRGYEVTVIATHTFWSSIRRTLPGRRTFSIDACALICIADTIVQRPPNIAARTFLFSVGWAFRAVYAVPVVASAHIELALSAAWWPRQMITVITRSACSLPVFAANPRLTISVDAGALVFLAGDGTTLVLRSRTALNGLACVV
jgi:hypothetical protein